ncbi:MAG TPA: iron-containing alcohol dehydrogenase, partial [Candidatus Binatia bacterium]|nr:iron-containing alcohol dehydrogenase [Candidatus Binatia bacterium]
MALISYLTNVQFDFGARACLESELPKLGITRPLIVTDKGVMAAGLLDKIKESLPGNMPLEVFDETPENPTERATLAALARYREAGCDGLIALGGGSAMDLAKALAVLATHPAPLPQYMAILGGT